jgi:hypothetical protein
MPISGGKIGSTFGTSDQQPAQVLVGCLPAALWATGTIQQSSEVWSRLNSIYPYYSPLSAVQWEQQTTILQPSLDDQGQVSE